MIIIIITCLCYHITEHAAIDVVGGAATPFIEAAISPPLRHTLFFATLHAVAADARYDVSLMPMIRLIRFRFHMLYA